MKLYAHRFCPYSRRVRIALAEHDVDYEYVELDPKAPHPPELIGKTPSGHGVPVLLVRDDLALWDSTAIIYWLDSAYPRSLMPSAREPQAIARSWVGWVASKLFPLIKDLRIGDATAKQRAKEKMAAHLRDIEPMMQDGWMVGTEFSIADVAMAPALAALPKSIRDDAPPKVAKYIERLCQRPSVREVCELDEIEARPSWAA